MNIISVDDVKDISSLPVGSIGSTAPTLLRMRNSHRQLARELAKGMRPVDASAVCGFSLSRISILQNDPAFQELIAHYQAQVEEIQVDTVQRMNNLALDSVEEIHHRLDTTPDEFTTDQLLNISKSFLDRSGFGKTSVKEQKITFDVTALEELKREAEGKASRVIDMSKDELSDFTLLREPKVVQAVE